MDRKVSAPQIIDQLACRHGSPQADEEVGQQAADLCLANLDEPAVLRPDRQRPEHAKTHQVRITGRATAACCSRARADSPATAGRQPAPTR